MKPRAPATATATQARTVSRIFKSLSPPGSAAARGDSPMDSKVSPAIAIVSQRSSRLELRRRSPHHRSEEHTSELQSHSDLVCRLLLEKKKNTDNRTYKSR